MKPVFQQPMDGQCVRASICSIFEIPLELGPKVHCETSLWDDAQKKFHCEPHKQVSKWKDSEGKDRESISYSCEGQHIQDQWVNEWAAQFGLVYVDAYTGYGPREAGLRPGTDYKLLPAGLCIASGGSPRFAGNHAVVWDTRLRDFEHPYGRMVHDPAPVPEGTRPGLTNVQQFHWFEIENPALLVNLALLRKVA